MGALNASGTSTALFSNVGPWVNTYAVGASVLSTFPPFHGGLQASARDDRYGRRRESCDPDDYRGGFALWSGTSFAAPLVAARIAARLGTISASHADAAADAYAAVEAVLAEE